MCGYLRVNCQHAFATVMQGLIKLTSAWLRRLHTMICFEATKTDPCMLRFHDWETNFGSRPLRVIQCQSLNELLQRFPVFVGILRQYAAAHASEIVSASSEAGSSANVDSFEVSRNLHRAMQECVVRCVVRSFAVVF